jgi:peptidoglycan/LPS O-acetylase OafA/YrhL
MHLELEAKNQNLQCLRGIAILLVAVFHFTWRWQDFYPWGKYVSDSWFFVMTNGVQLFFMISGWVIYASLIRTGSFFKFIKNRMIRLAVPLFLIAPLLYIFQKVFPVEPFKEVFPNQILTSISMINPTYFLFFFDIKTDWITGVQWTLTYEITFYLLSSFVFYKISQRHVFEFMLGMANFILIANYLYLYLNNQIGQGYYLKDVNSPSVEYVIQQSGLLHLSWFVLGMWFYKFSSNRQSKKVIAYLANLIFLCAWDISQGRVAFSQPKQTMFAIAMLTLFIIFFFQLKTQFSKRFLRSITQIFESLGNVSYEFYLLHEIVGVTLLLSFSKITFIYLHPEIYPFLIFLVLITLYAASFAINKLYSEPTQRYLKTKFVNHNSR